MPPAWTATHSRQVCVRSSSTRERKGCTMVRHRFHTDAGDKEDAEIKADVEEDPHTHTERRPHSSSTDSPDGGWWVKARPGSGWRGAACCGSSAAAGGRKPNGTAGWGQGRGSAPPGRRRASRRAEPPVKLHVCPGCKGIFFNASLYSKAETLLLCLKITVKLSNPPGPECCPRPCYSGLSVPSETTMPTFGSETQPPVRANTE